MTNVAVIGAGSLGLKIAGTLMFNGCKVWVYDSNSKVLNAAPQKIEKDMEYLRREGMLKTSNYSGDLYYVNQLETAVRTADFIFEAVSEDLHTKQDVFKKISRLCKREAVIATSSMNLKCDDVVQKALHKSRCLGVRFLYPVFCIQEVEVSLSNETSPTTLEKVRLFLMKMGKVAYLRSQTNPLVLDEKQIENKKAAFIKSLQSSANSLNCTGIPDLGSRISRPSTLSLQEDSNRQKVCAICMKEERNCVFSPCGHFCSCNICGLKIFEQGKTCPICRVPIQSVLSVYEA